MMCEEQRRQIQIQTGIIHLRQIIKNPTPSDGSCLITVIISLHEGDFKRKSNDLK